MAILKKCVHILAMLCYICIVIYALACIPNFFGYKPLVVLTGSMEPTYRIGSVIYYQKVNNDELKEGDVITFTTSDNKLVTHRISKIEGDVFTTKGDANDTEDPNKVTRSDIKGKVITMCIPYLGYYVHFINKNMYLILVVVVILILEFLFSNIKTINMYRSKE